ncbi:unnamed protein product, partial [Mycena citricolor]
TISHCDGGHHGLLLHHHLCNAHEPLALPAPPHDPTHRPPRPPSHAPNLPLRDVRADRRGHPDRRALDCTRGGERKGEQRNFRKGDCACVELRVSSAIGFVRACVCAAG